MSPPGPGDTSERTFATPRGFDLRWFLVGFVGLLGGVAAAGLLLSAAGYPWNLMRDQPAVQSQERPVRTQPDRSQPFLKQGWPREGYAVSELPEGLVRERGPRLYRIHCSHCHGSEGLGNGPVASKLAESPPNLQDWGVQMMAPRDIHRLIANPKGVMPPFEERLSYREREILVRFILREFSPDQSLTFEGMESIEHGSRLFTKLRCNRCHGPDRPLRTPGLPPSLAFAGNKLEEEWVRGFLRDPRPRRWKKRGTRAQLHMPRFRLGNEQIQALTDYLMSKRQDERFEDPELDWDRASPEDLEKGRKLFAQHDCYECHVIGQRGGHLGPNLTHVGRRLRGDYVYNFILDPKKYIPDTRMKDRDLTKDEAIRITQFLMQSR